jgi:hypothetical protein
MSEAKPSVGRIVHVTTTGGRCRAAIVTDVVSPGVVEVAVFDPPGLLPGLSYDEDRSARTWHWPAKV